MSSAISEIRDRAEVVALEAVWSQWGALTPAAATADTRAAWTVIDPEALILASLALMPVGQRLGDLVAAWAREAGFLMSKSRFASSRARDLYERHEKRLSQAEIFLPSSRKRAGEGFLEDLYDAVDVGLGGP